MRQRIEAHALHAHARFEQAIGVGFALIEQHVEAGEINQRRRHAAQILRDLGVTSIRLYASRERHYVGLEGFGIRIEGTEPI